MDASMVIIGGGLAGAKTAEALRDHGYDGAITLVAGESDHPYERPPLSKGYLAGQDARDSTAVHEPRWYEEHRVTVLTGVLATRIDRDAHRVLLDDDQELSYRKLVLATGSSPRRLPDAKGALYLRTLDDSDALKKVIGTGKRLAVVGAGWIGLEVAATARQGGAEVTVIEPAEQPLLKVLGAKVAAGFADLHREKGVDLRLGTGAESITTNSVTTDAGDVVDADAVLVGIGARPNVLLAEEAGLTVTDGVDVDAGLRTSDPDVYAVGDIANQDHPTLGRLRVEHWANALNQPAVAAANMLGVDEVYSRLPYFFTDQYDLGMEYRGHASGDDPVVIRGDLAGREYCAFWLRDGRVAAGMNVNIWDQGDAIAALVEGRRTVDPDALADPSIPLTDL